MSKYMESLLKLSGIEITAKINNFMNIIQIQVEEMTENTKYQTIIKAGLQIALLFLNMNKEHPLLQKYNIRFDGYEYLIWDVYA